MGHKNFKEIIIIMHILLSSMPESTKKERKKERKKEKKILYWNIIRMTLRYCTM